MKNTMALILAAAMGTGAWAKGVTPGPAVTVCMDSEDATTERAEMEAASIFSELGVKISWRSGRACAAGDAIQIHLSTHTAATLKPGALAYARPYQRNYIEVFYDRVTVTVHAEALVHLLAHVLVHEITHILEGIARHSETGIMKAHWNANDYREMCSHHLPFAAEDVELIQLGMQDRAERLAAAAAATGLHESR